MSLRLRELLYAWLPLLLWLVVIAIESTSTLSAANTGRVLHRLAVALFGAIDTKTFDIVHALLRKSGHFVGYAILSLLFFRALLRTAQIRGRELLAGLRLRLGAWAIFATFVVASLDEWHQGFLPARTGRLHDVLLDTAGAIACQCALLLSSVRTAQESESGQ